VSDRSSAPVAVVVVSWNSAPFLGECLRSLRALRRPPAEVVVVDNASQDGSADLVRREFPEVDLVQNPRNLGFCAATNLGIRKTYSPFVLLLNPDAWLAPDFLERLLPAFADPRVGLAAGKLLRRDATTLDSAGQQLGRSRQPKDRGYGVPDRGQYDRDEEVFGACGAAALCRRAMLESIAGPGPSYLDEAFFAFYEDLDLAWRARRLGWTAAYRYGAVGYHARGHAGHGGGRGRFPAVLARAPEVRFHIVKNRYLTILRNDTVAGYLGNLPFILARDLATVGLLLFCSPGVLGRVWQERRLFSRALQLRRLDAARPRHHVPDRGT
jgi:GT2 family glycosyltransferase